MLVELLNKQGWLKTPRIIKAFQQIKRVDFLPQDVKDLAEVNEALPIGQGQTISQPLVVAFMLELLQPQPGEKILDIGSGSGWTSALLAHIVSQKGNSKLPGRKADSPKGCIPNRKQNPKSRIQNLKSKVIAIEIIPELKEFGEENVAKYNFIEKQIAEFILADGSKGYEREAPFDKILCSAAIQNEIPQAWKEQLKIGGRIVTSINNSISLFIKKSAPHQRAGGGEFEQIEYPGFIFVPLVSK